MMSYHAGFSIYLFIGNLLFIPAVFIFAHNDTDNDVTRSVWVHLNKYHLKWRVNYREGEVTFEVAVKTNGWVGAGMLQDRTRILNDFDLWIGWVDGKGKPHLWDCHGDSNGYATADKRNDLQIIGYKKSKRLTSLKFKRKISTGDSEDIEIKEGLRKFIFAWRAEIPNTKNPCRSFEKRKTHMIFRDIDILHEIKKLPLLPPHTKYFDLVHKKVKVPAQRTTYWCTKLRLSDIPDLKSPSHIIAIKPLIQKRGINIIHHMVLHSCYIKANETYATFSGPCFRDSMPASVNNCGMLGGMFAWALGMPTFHFPENAGYPIDGNDTSRYFFLQAHFNNELLKNDIEDTSGLRFYYTKPRKYDAGMLTVGATISDDMIIPPGMKKWTIKSACVKSCTQKMRPTRRIKLFATLPHGHATTVGIRTIVVRNGIEVDEVIRVDNFKMKHQHFYRLKRQIEVREGDEIFNYCTYRTLGKKYAITGGMGSEKEMCLNFIMYYPKIDIEACLSSEMVTHPAFTTKYARPVFVQCAYGDSAVEDFSNWRYSNWTGVEWTTSMKKELYMFYNKNDPRPMVQPVCRGRGGVKYDLPPIYRPIVKKRSRRSCSNAP